MTDDERRGRDWCDNRGKGPGCRGDYWYWLSEGLFIDDDRLPAVLYQAVSHVTQVVSSRQTFETDADAYAAVGKALAEMRAVCG